MKYNTIIYTGTYQTQHWYSDIHDLRLNTIRELLMQVEKVHHDGRPDLFRYDQKKYTDEQLKKLIHDDLRPIFVAVDERDYQQFRIG